jgi:cytochrome P450
MGDDEIGGHRIPRGSLAFSIPSVVHRRAALWPNPERFDPGRFMPDRESACQKFFHIPFGGTQNRVRLTGQHRVPPSLACDDGRDVTCGP